MAIRFTIVQTWQSTAKQKVNQVAGVQIGIATTLSTGQDSGITTKTVTQHQTNQRHHKG